MSPRKIAPIAGGALLLTALLLLYFSRTLDWNWTELNGIGSESPAVPLSDHRFSFESVQLNVNVSLTKEDFAQLHENNASFMSKYPHIHVNLTNEASSPELFAQWAERSERGMEPDLMLMENGWVVPFAVKGFLKPVDGLMSGDSLSDQLAGLTEPLRWNGYLWGVPHNIDPFLLLWNKELLREAGIAKLPHDGPSLQEAVNGLASLQREEPLRLINLSPGDLRQLLVWTGTFYGDSGKLINLKGITDEQREGLKWLQSIEPFISAIAGTRHLQLSQEIEANRLLAALLTWEQYAKLTTAARDKLEMDDKMLYPWLGGSSFVISSRSSSEAEAMLWIEEITGAARGRLAYQYSGKLPVRASLYSEAGRLLTQSQPSPPLWWYEAMSARAPEHDMMKADKEWPIRWQQWQQLWAALSGDEELRPGDWAAALPHADE